MCVVEGSCHVGLSLVVSSMFEVSMVLPFPLSLAFFFNLQSYDKKNGMH